MDETKLATEDQIAVPVTPEDVAILYSWANLPGAKYRDFSASRREYRARQRAKAAEAQRETELQAAKELEEAAQREIEEAQRELEATRSAEAKAQSADDEGKLRAEQALRRAEERAEVELQEAQRRQQSAEDLRLRAERAREEMIEARDRAEEQALRYAEADAQYQTVLSSPDVPEVPGKTTDPYYFSGPVDPANFASIPGVRTAQATRSAAPRQPPFFTGDSASGTFRGGAAFAYTPNTFGPSPTRIADFRPVFSEEQGQRRQQIQDEPSYISGPVDEDIPSPYPDLDDSYYDGGPVTNIFTPSPREVYPSSRTLAASDLHIPPASRERVEPSGRFGPSMRPAPMPNLSAPAPREMNARWDTGWSPTAHLERRGEAAGNIRSRRAAERSREFLMVDPFEPSGGPDSRFIPREEKEEELEDREARMFIPSSRRRVPAVEDARRAQAFETHGEEMGWSDRGDERMESARRGPGIEAGASSSDTRGPVPNAPSQPVERNIYGKAGAHGRMQGRRMEWPGMEIEYDLPMQASSEPSSPAWLSSERPASRGGRSHTAPVQRTAEPESRNVAPRSGALPESRPGRVPAAEKRTEPRETTGGPQGPVAPDTLQQSRERFASRWFALSSLMGESEGPEQSPFAEAKPAPMLSVLSISGGVGKTSIVATLGRALSSMGEKVLLVDTNLHGILPYYFGARDPREDAVRTFLPPAGSTDAPVVLVRYGSELREHGKAIQEQVLDDLHARAEETQRVLLDVGASSEWIARALHGKDQTVLVPVTPDVNSILGTQAVERLFENFTHESGIAVKPFYVLNQFDPSLPLHLDVREVLQQFLGDRLLPVMLHCSPAVSEALAEGMTVIDYAPGTPIVQDYMNLAKWVRRLSGPGMHSGRSVRWSER